MDIQEFKSRLLVAKRDVRLTRAVTLSSANKAGEVFALHIPTGELSEAQIYELLSKVKKYRRDRLSRLHPDRCNGVDTEAAKNERGAVEAAADTITRYLKAGRYGKSKNRH
jgi:hypothetical protein